MNTEGKRTQDNLIELYALLVDQMQAYKRIIWQVPTALIVANVLALNSFATNQLVLFALVVFNFALIFAFYKMVITQRSLIDATKALETKLEETYGDFIPKFKKSKVRAPSILIAVLFLLNGMLLIHSLLLRII